jgi:hypothetical protein
MLRKNLLFLLLFNAAFLIGQVCNCPDLRGTKSVRNNELGIVLFSITGVKGAIYPRNYAQWYDNLNALMYKRHYRKGAFRLGAGYVYGTLEQHWDGVNPWRYWRLNNYGELSLGYERRFFRKAFKIYMAADLVFSYGRIKVSTEQSGWAGATGEFYDFRIREIGIAPAAGVRYQFSRKFSMNAESSFTVNAFSDHQIKEKVNRKGLALLLNPLQAFSFNYHF